MVTSFRLIDNKVGAYIRKDRDDFPYLTDTTLEILGSQANSNRDGFVVYMGTKVFGVKWTNWKLHFQELEDWSAATTSYEMPRLYDLLVDPGETNNVLFPNTWVPQAALPLLQEHVASLRENPPIKAGTPDPYAPAE